jgi:multiple sugar transport system substrate-binding protein
MGTDMMGQFAATGALEPVPGTVDPSAFFEGAWNTNVVDGTVYGVPWYVETRLLYYRTDIAEAAGITAPPATWDELKAAAQAIKGGGGAEWGISLGTKNWQEYVPFLWSNGGQIMDDQGAFHLNSPEAVEALTFYNSFFDEALTPTTVRASTSPPRSWPDAPDVLSSPWHIRLITGAGAPILVTGRSPRAEQVSTSFVSGAARRLRPASSDLAWRFVEF